MCFSHMADAYNLDGLKTGEKMLLMSLSNYADEDGFCYPSKETLMIKCCFTKRTCDAHMASLKALNLIKITRRKKGNINDSNLYELLFKKKGIVSVRGVRQAKAANDNSAKSAPPHDAEIAPPIMQNLHHEAKPMKTNSAKSAPPHDAEIAVGQILQSGGAKSAPNTINDPINNNININMVDSGSLQKGAECPLMQLPTTDGFNFDVTQSYIDDLAPCYPDLFLHDAFLGIKQWLVINKNNPDKPKPLSVIPMFIKFWLDRAIAQIKKGHINPYPHPKKPRLPVTTKPVIVYQAGPVGDFLREQDKAAELRKAKAAGGVQK